MKKMLATCCAVLFATSAMADGQVFYRYGKANLSEDRGGEVFVDAGGSKGKNSGDGDYVISAGLDLKLLDCPMGNSLMGEIMVDYAKFSSKKVARATDVLLSTGADAKEVTVSELSVVVAPKYRIDKFGKIRPWIIPAGLAFMVASPPSNSTNYLDVGYHAAAGVEYVLHKNLSLGADYRYTAGMGETDDLKIKYSSYAGYVGINF